MTLCRTLAIFGLMGLLSWPLAADASIFYCRDKSGRTWMTNKKVKGARCKLAIKTPKKKVAKKKAPRAAKTTAPPRPTQPVPVPAASRPNPPAALPPPTYRPPPRNTVEIIWPGQPTPMPAARSVVADRPGRRDEPKKRSEREALYAPYVEEAAALHDLPEPLINAIVRAESNFRYRSRDKTTGAKGLMMLRPGLARDLGLADRFDARGNILAGARQLRRLANRLNGDLSRVIAAWHQGYSGGDTAVVDVERSARYVQRVLDYYYGYVDAAEPRP